MMTNGICNKTYEHSGPTETQKEIISKKIPNGFSSSLMCGDSSSGSGTCPGNSGAPALYEDRTEFKKHRWIQVGLVQGNIEPCSTEKFPLIMLRLDDIDIYEFIVKTAFGTDFKMTRK